MAKIGVEQSLTNVHDELKSQGYDVVFLQREDDARYCDCCVISGQDSNVMGIEDVVTQGSVIDARAMSAEDVCREIDSRMK
jgi:hypothetical protein